MSTQENTAVAEDGCILNGESLGSPISQELSDYLKEYTTNNDRANVSIDTGVGTSTIRDVTYRNNNLTQDNSRAIKQLVLIAKERCETSVTRAEGAIEYLDQKIKS